MTAAERCIAVVGGGFSGAVTALHLTRLSRGEHPVVLFEPADQIGPGVAYGTPTARHLLNVRAANMSAYADDPTHFERWLAASGADDDDRHETEAGIFASRRLYARYLRETFDAEGGDSVRRIQAKIVSCRRSGDGYLLTDAEGRDHPARAVILATGHVTPPAGRDRRHVTNPWDAAWLEGLDPTAPILIRGTALTMVDIVLTLREAGFEGPITALSRRGLAPRAHRAASPWPMPAWSREQRSTVLGVMRLLRREAESARRRGVDWRSVVDSIRPITAEIWQGWSLSERRRFMRHARRYWDVLRHRLAPPAAAWLDTELRGGRLRIEAGRISRIVPQADGVRVDWTAGDGESRSLLCQRVIEATGLTGMREACPGLVEDLLSQGLARLDPQGQGLDVGDDLSVRGADGRTVAGLWALGPMVRGTFWECIAVPDIRRQAEACAKRVVAALDADQAAS